MDGDCFAVETFWLGGDFGFTNTSWYWLTFSFAATGDGNGDFGFGSTIRSVLMGTVAFGVDWLTGGNDLNGKMLSIFVSSSEISST